MIDVIVKVTINDSINTYNGLFDKENSLLIYTDIDKYENMLYLNENKLVRKKNNISLIINTDNKKPYIEYNTEYGKINIPITVLLIIKDNHKFELKYLLEGEQFDYMVCIEKFVEKTVDFVSK